MLKQGFLLAVVVLCTACVSQANHTDKIEQWLDKPAHVQAQAIASGDTTSAELVSGYLARIERLDEKVNSVLALNPNALTEAKAIDKRLANGETLGPLAGIPVLLKDNIKVKRCPPQPAQWRLLLMTLVAMRLS